MQTPETQSREGERTESGRGIAQTTAGCPEPLPGAAVPLTDLKLPALSSHTSFLPETPGVSCACDYYHTFSEIHVIRHCLTWSEAPHSSINVNSLTKFSKDTTWAHAAVSAQSNCPLLGSVSLSPICAVCVHTRKTLQDLMKRFFLSIDSQEKIIPCLICVKESKSEIFEWKLE